MTSTQPANQPPAADLSRERREHLQAAERHLSKIPDLGGNLAAVITVAGLAHDEVTAALAADDTLAERGPR